MGSRQAAVSLRGGGWESAQSDQALTLGFSGGAAASPAGCRCYEASSSLWDSGLGRFLVLLALTAIARTSQNTPRAPKAGLPESRPTAIQTRATSMKARPESKNVLTVPPPLILRFPWLPKGWHQRRREAPAVACRGQAPSATRLPDSDSRPSPGVVRAPMITSQRMISISPRASTVNWFATRA